MNPAGKGPASSPGQASRAWPGAGTCAKLAQGDFAPETTRSRQVVPGLARLPAPTGPLPPSPCPTCAHPAWVTEGHPPGLWSGSWLQPAPAVGEPPPCSRSPAHSCLLPYPTQSALWGTTGPPRTASAKAPTAASCCPRSRAAPAEGRPSASGEAERSRVQPALVASGLSKAHSGEGAAAEALGEWEG